MKIKSKIFVLLIIACIFLSVSMVSANENLSDEISISEEHQFELEVNQKDTENILDNNNEIIEEVKEYKDILDSENPIYNFRNLEGANSEVAISRVNYNNITTIEEANEYLINVFVPYFNKKFALNYKNFESVFEASPNEEKINYKNIVF